MKILLILLDGLGDRAYETLGHRTPLQAAATPNLDRLAGLGSNGLFHASVPGECLPSETAHYLLFGYERERFPGRGLLEAMGFHIPFRDGDVLSLAHLCGVDWVKGTPILREPRRAFMECAEETKALYDAIETGEAEGVRFRLYQTSPNDAVLVMSGEVSPDVSDADPMVSGKPVGKVVPLPESPEPIAAARTAAALNRYLSRCHHILSGHRLNRQRVKEGRPPANFLGTLRAGRRAALDPFERRWGLKGAMIASGAVYAGLAHELGLAFTSVSDGPDPGEDLRRRIGMALEDREHEFIHVHTKAPDEAAHKGDPLLKTELIAALDSALSEVTGLAASGTDLLLAVTADHSTPSRPPLIHSGEPVPLVIAGPRVRRDAVSRFNEIDAACGCLGMLRGRELMLMLLNYADRSALAGHRMGGPSHPYFPASYEPFSLDP